MKLIIAIVQPHRLEAIKTKLSAVEVFRLTIVDCQGFGRQLGRSEMEVGDVEPEGVDELTINLRRKVQMQIAVNEEFVEPTIAAIRDGGRSGNDGQIGDGKIFVIPMDDCIRIRTGERGPAAI